MIAAIIPAKNWLWTTKLTPMAEGVVVDRPLYPTSYERQDGQHMAVIEADVAEGAVLVTTQAGMPERFGTYYVVLDGLLQHVWEHEAADLLDPAGANRRLHARLRHQAGLDDVSRRIRVRPDHGLVPGAFRRWGSWWGVVGRVTAQQASVRAASYAEILAAGETLPVAPTGTALISAIQAEAAADTAEAAAAPAAAAA